MNGRRARRRARAHLAARRGARAARAAAATHNHRGTPSVAAPFLAIFELWRAAARAYGG